MTKTKYILATVAFTLHLHTTASSSLEKKEEDWACNPEPSEQALERNPYCNQNIKFEPWNKPPNDVNVCVAKGKIFIARGNTILGFWDIYIY